MMMLDKNKPNPGPVMDFERLTATQVGWLYNTKHLTVGNWVRRSGCPRNKDGTYDLAQVIKWREERIESKHAQSETLEDTKEKIAKVDLQRKELALERDLLEVIPKDEVETGRVARVVVLKRTMLALPRRMSSVLEGLEAREVEAILNEHLRDLISQFSGQSEDK